MRLSEFINSYLLIESQKENEFEYLPLILHLYLKIQLRNTIKRSER